MGRIFFHSVPLQKPAALCLCSISCQSSEASFLHLISKPSAFLFNPKKRLLLSIRIGFATKKATNKTFHSFLTFSVFWLVCCPCPACSFIKACTVRPIFSVAILPPSIYLQQLKRRLKFCRAFRIHQDSRLCCYAVPRLNDTNFIQICADVLERLWC